MGHHTSDVLKGLGGSDVLWGDYDPIGQPVEARLNVRRPCIPPAEVVTVALWH